MTPEAIILMADRLKRAVVPGIDVRRLAINVTRDEFDALLEYVARYNRLVTADDYQPLGCDECSLLGVAINATLARAPEV